MDGNVTIINGDLVDDPGSKVNMASADNITGEYQEIDRIFGWAWYHVKEFFSF